MEALRSFFSHANIAQSPGERVLDGGAETAEEAVKETGGAALDAAKAFARAARAACVQYLGGGDEAERIVDALTLFFGGMLAVRGFEKCLDAAHALAWLALRFVALIFRSIHLFLHALSRAVVRTLAVLAFFVLLGAAAVASGAFPVPRPGSALHVAHWLVAACKENAVAVWFKGYGEQGE